MRFYTITLIKGSRVSRKKSLAERTAAVAFKAMARQGERRENTENEIA